MTCRNRSFINQDSVCVPRAKNETSDTGRLGEGLCLETVLKPETAKSCWETHTEASALGAEMHAV